MDGIVTALLGHEQRRKNNLSKDSFRRAFVVRGDYNDEDKKDNRKKKGPQCYKCKGWGHKKAKCLELKKTSVIIAKKQMTRIVMVMFSQYSVKSLVKLSCWIQLARFMQHQRSGSRHTLSRMEVLLT